MTDFSGKSIGFVGLGAMGRPMAGHLASKLAPNCKLYVYDVVQEAVDSFCQQYERRQMVVATKSAKEVAENSVSDTRPEMDALHIINVEISFLVTKDIVVTMVPEGSHVKVVYLDPSNGICSTNIAGKLLIDCSTIDTATSQLVKDHIDEKFPTASLYDAPVSGGVVGAEKGTIAVFLGCAEDDTNLAQLKGLLRMMGSHIIPCGAPTFGLAAKLSNNYLSGIIAIACSEALDMGMRSGLDPRVLSKVYAAGTAQNTISDRFNPCPGVYPEAPSTNGYKGGFKVQLMRKDFGLAVDMAQRVGSKNVLGDIGLNVYEAASKDPKCRDLDSRVVYRYLGGNEDWQSR